MRDAAERAVRAAPAILEEVTRIVGPDGRPLRARLGVATGLVVVGEMIGAGPAREHTIVGETPNLAARLQALAEPDTILISESTQQLVRGLFALEYTGAHALKGFSRPAPAWRALHEASAPSRFAATRSGSVPFLGRSTEMGLLLDHWRLARQGEGQVVTVVGEAGIGKSRVAERVREEVAGERRHHIRLQCSPYYIDSAFYPLIRHLGRDSPPAIRRMSGSTSSAFCSPSA